MSTPTPEEIIATYRREAAREASEVASGNMNESTHGSVLAATRTHVHYTFCQPPDAVASMQQAWAMTDAAIKAAGIWDKPPPGGLAIAPVASVSVDVSAPNPVAAVSATSASPVKLDASPSKKVA